MSWDGFWKMIWEEREWVFSGIGITVLTTVWVIVKSVWKKKPVDKTGTHEKIKKNSENTISGGQNIVGNNNNITHNDNSNVNTVIGSGNVTGSGNNVTNNYYYANNDTEERDKSWFSERFDILLANLNQARRFGEKEYTQVIHRDPNPGNIIVAEDKWGFIDFELSERNIRIFDPCYAATAILSESFEFGNESKLAKWIQIYKNIINGYDDVVKLTAAEKKAVPYVVLSNQLIALAWFEGKEKYQEIYETNVKMTEWLVSVWSELSVE